MKMSDSPANLAIANPTLADLSVAESVRAATNRAPADYLLAETVAVTIGVILAIKLLAATSFAGALWFLGPAALVTAALLPPIVRKDRFPEIGLNSKRIKQALGVLAGTCLIVFPATFAGLWLLRLYGIEPPLRVVTPGNQQLISWIFYQFLYVAVAEEVFFRGYLQTNILRLTAAMSQGQLAWKCSPALQKRISIVLCAACFAIAHIIVHGQIAFALTFFPALILGWLFVRTKSLLAPILFHALANTTYCIMAATLA